ncbi:hypothetical protein L227DRAFT_394464 [Lentinus tigrinus ALCF2SS1-6]|uniref:Uncharacterized protein n=1 Tax=Lentinus tigrinus ALCF2SS1-6 TaxID=1328759 RepID=A0A5C2SJZ0_9APHY|nr:hypothetical protein L227DRAFT_394464 [Lentinus tigrinus ALCF2SS1-6]
MRTSDYGIELRAPSFNTSTQRRQRWLSPDGGLSRLAGLHVACRDRGSSSMSTSTALRLQSEGDSCGCRCSLRDMSRLPRLRWRWPLQMVREQPFDAQTSTLRHPDGMELDVRARGEPRPKAHSSLRRGASGTVEAVCHTTSRTLVGGESVSCLE